MPGFWRKCRTFFRWLRLAVLLLVLSVVCCVAWFDWMGLPGFLKPTVVAALADQGVRVDFSRLRLRVLRGVVAEGVRASGTGTNQTPGFSAREIQIRLGWRAMLQRRLEVRGVEVRDAVLDCPLSERTTLNVTNLNLNLEFGPEETWTVQRCTAEVAGVRLTAEGAIRHAPKLADWSWFQARAGERPAGNSPWVDQTAEILRRLRLADVPQVDLKWDGDAAVVESFRFSLDTQLPPTVSPWGRFAEAKLSVNGRLTGLEKWPFLQVRMQTDRLDSRWGWLRQADLSVQVRQARLELWPALDVRLHAGQAETQWGGWQGGSLTVASESVPLKQLPPVKVRGEFQWAWNALGGAQGVRWDARMVADSASEPPDRRGLGYWSGLSRWRLAGTARADSLQTSSELPALALKEVAVAGAWQFPNLTVNRVQARLGGGRMSVGGALDVVTRQLEFTNDFSFDLHEISPWLAEKSRQQLERTRWGGVPQLRGAGRLELPPWEGGAGDWREGASATLAAHEEFAFTNLVLHGVLLEELAGTARYTNRIWEVSGLRVAAGKCRVAGDFTADAQTKSFTARMAGRLDPALAHQLSADTNAFRGLRLLQMTEPAAVSAVVRGTLSAPDSWTAAGHLAVTNFAVREQSIDSLDADFTWSNGVASLTGPVLRREGGQQSMTADVVALDTATRRLYFTHGFTTVDVAVVARAIGPKTARTLLPYQFLAAPTARVEGYVTLHLGGDNHDLEGVDLNFDLQRPVPFRWERLGTPGIVGKLHWTGPALVLTNAVADFYGGEAHGWAAFDFGPAHAGTLFQFGTQVTNLDLHRIAADFSTPTNHLEGRLSGWLQVTAADSATMTSWQGYGRAVLTNGLILDFPVFGVLSPVLNRMSSGLGDTRATEAAADFIITNGVIATDSLVIHTKTSRLVYRGSVNFQAQVDARVTLELLRNTPWLGAVISTAFSPLTKAFEYHLTGSLSNPNSTPVYVPDFLLVPLHPFHSLKDLFSSEDKPGTNAPAK